MSDDVQRLWAKIADLERRATNTFQVGTVEEVSGTKIRMKIGENQGKPVLSQWLNTCNQRGGAREQRFYKKGQTLSLVCPGGDITQGMIAPYAPNQEFPTPEHAKEADGNENEESFQLAAYRGKETDKGHDYWLQDEEKKQGQQQGSTQGGGGQQQKQQGHIGGDKAQVKTRMSKEDGHTLRFGKDDGRMHAGKKGAKIRMASDWVVVTKGKIVLSQPPILGKDPLKNDNA